MLKLGAVDVADMKDADCQPFVAYLQQNARSPIEYVVDKFNSHDVVILGEIHEVRENCEFISDLMEPLHRRAHVGYFAMEAIKYKNSDLANQLVTGQQWDEELALRIFRDCAWPTWGFREYVAILRSIWEVNQHASSQAEQLKVIGLDTDWDAYALQCGSASEKDKAMAIVKRRDREMAEFVAREVLDKGAKALVQIGYNHSFTHYRQPAVEQGRFVGELPPRFGYILREEYGDRVFQVCLHKPHFSPEVATGGTASVRPVLGGLMEKVFESNGNTPAGFDVHNSPFAHLRDKASYYFAFQDYAVFSDIARGYVFLKPVSALGKITWIRGFIDNSNFEKARAISLSRGWITPEECSTAEELDERLRSLFECP